MLAIIAIFIIASVIASVLVLAASMHSSRLNDSEGHFVNEEYEVEQNSPDVPASEASHSSS